MVKVSESTPEELSCILETTFKALEDLKLLPIDLIAAVLHSLFIEADFKLVKPRTRLLSQWRTEKQKSFGLNYVYSKNYKITVDIRKMPFFYSIYAYFNLPSEDNSELKDFFLEPITPSFYVKIEENKSTLKYEKLSFLCTMILNVIIKPLLNAIKIHNGTYPGKESLECLPAELLTLLGTYLNDPKDLCRMEQCSKHCKQIFQSDSVWKDIFIKKYPEEIQNYEQEKISWKEKFRRVFESKKGNETRFPTFFPLSTPPPSPPRGGGGPPEFFPPNFRPRRPPRFDPPFPYYRF